MDTDLPGSGLSSISSMAATFLSEALLVFRMIGTTRAWAQALTRCHATQAVECSSASCEIPGRMTAFTMVGSDLGSSKGIHCPYQTIAHCPSPTFWVHMPKISLLIHIKVTLQVFKKIDLICIYIYGNQHETINHIEKNVQTYKTLHCLYFTI